MKGGKEKRIGKKLLGCQKHGLEFVTFSPSLQTQVSLAPFLYMKLFIKLPASGNRRKYQKLCILQRENFQFDFEVASCSIVGEQ